MSLTINANFEAAAKQIIDVAQRFSAVLNRTGIPYRVVGGMAAFLHVECKDPLAARLTRDIDVAIERSRLSQIRVALEPHGFRYQDVGGVDTFVISNDSRPRSTIQIVFVNEKVRPEYLEPVPASQPVRTKEGILIAPVADLVLMKLTSFRLKDKVHIQDLDGVGLITPEIEAGLSDVLRARLAEVRATE